ncbi:hypothetical protein Q1M64_14470 (plasmid) [Sinorhizobium meliloti]|nr:hypothetical protein Q1M63_15900 [Sinorhizobium meliloti]WKL40472.1 hypothetical protein Q1M64_14470 [Sinorhizobium meliloti]
MSVLISILITFLVVILVLYLVNRLPLDGRTKQIVQAIVIIIGIPVAAAVSCCVLTVTGVPSRRQQHVNAACSTAGNLGPASPLGAE